MNTCIHTQHWHTCILNTDMHAYSTLTCMHSTLTYIPTEMHTYIHTHTPIYPHHTHMFSRYACMCVCVCSYMYVYAWKYACMCKVLSTCVYVQVKYNICLKWFLLDNLSFSLTLSFSHTHIQSVSFHPPSRFLPFPFPWHLWNTVSLPPSAWWMHICPDKGSVAEIMWCLTLDYSPRCIPRPLPLLS